MSLERTKFKEAAACVATLGALASLTACDDGASEQRESSVIGHDPRPNLDCTSAGFFTDYATGERMLSVNVRNARNRDVNVDSVRVRELETNNDRHYTLTENRSPVSISRQAIQVVVSIEKDGHAYACPTIYYPNRS